jgi:hypothetical protein
VSTTTRVWLSVSRKPTPSPWPAAVRDDRARIWTHDSGDLYRTTDGDHHAHWTELTTLSDLVEVGATGPVLAAAGGAH